ncbi:MAG TPA: SDR family oxidoreductase [Acidimicrobiales bacterium]|nr:SDR family oxidoreductase [Acidimicrobiales bacterium]
MAPSSSRAATSDPSREAGALRTPAGEPGPGEESVETPTPTESPATRTAAMETAPSGATRSATRHLDRLGSPGTGVLVTGGGSGIGRETALALAEVGRPVAIWDVNAEGAEETAALCRDRYGSVVSWSVVDVSDTSAIEGAVPLVATALGSLGGFVHAAGVSGPMSVDFIDDELWDNTLNVNLRAAVMISRMLLEPFREAGPGSAAVLISSIEGLYGSAMLTAYCASKGGVLAVMRSIAQRFAMEGFRVNAVCPGAVSTPMLAPAFELPGFRQQLEERTPLQRISTPDEIAKPIRFLLSDEASFITGTYLTVDGGLTAVTAI